MMTHDTDLADIRRRYRNYRSLAEVALTQVSDAQLLTSLDAGDNSIAVMMQHVAGNLRSRFRDLLTADGEKPDRHRDAEFEDRPGTDGAALMGHRAHDAHPARGLCGGARSTPLGRPNRS